MTDKIAKVFSRLRSKEQRALKLILEKIFSGKFEGLDLVKIKGRDDIYRVRKGDMRIIFKKLSNGRIFILAIERRSDNTYRF